MWVDLILVRLSLLGLMGQILSLGNIHTRFFELDDVSDAQRVELAALHLEGKAFNGTELCKGKPLLS